ncbi:hypothetical protein K461DRAFT_320422 [Myriangium duriaei CBS 260.36]|uniref:Protein ZIP4 homolog n=1 Tax=Myriangium duriaei CBS 260.36 TaxID=1168546 RepID=A0A9P4J3U4_9PEZI|nr:hypothetical protein K461DRAFT_320422 [Myriangium duriaei CBS 260.36]
MPVDKLERLRAFDPEYLLELADRVQKRLVSGLIDQPLCAQIRTAIGNLPQTISRRASPLAAAFDQRGTEIWNLATRLGHGDTGNVTIVLPLIRAFALSLLKVSFRSTGSKGMKQDQAAVRILRTSLKSAKTCINSGELDLATDLLQDSADLAAPFSDGIRPHTHPHEDPVGNTARDLVVEYWLLRATLSWKQDRLDLAESHFKCASEHGCDGYGAKTKLSELAYEIGKDILRCTSGPDCIPWFEAASKALDRIPYDEMRSEALELRLSISRDLARALILEKKDQSCSRAADLISYLENEQGPKLGVLLLKVELLCSKNPLDPTEYHKIISQMIQNAVLSQNAFKSILLHIQKLHALSAPLAHRSLELLLTARLFGSGDQSSIEKAIIMLVWTCSTQPLDSSSFALLSETMDATSNAISSSFSDEATHAALTLCWKCIEAGVQAQRSDVAEQWCRLAMHRLFSNAGDNNKSKIARKLMIVALAAGKVPVAREAFYQMSQAGQSIPSSQYLLYRVALQDGEPTLANECLANLVRHSDTDAELLYACAQEAQQHNSREYTLTALQTIMQKAGSVHLKGLTLLALIRCVVQMLLVEIETGSGDVQAHLADVSRLLVMAAALIDTADSGDGGDRAYMEMQWFAKTSYNTAVRSMARSDPDQTLPIVDACLKFTKDLIASDKEANRTQASHRLLICYYIGASACAVLARSNDHVAASEEHYNKLLKYSSGFSEAAADIAAQDLWDKDDFDIASKRSQLLRLMIEALFKLKQFDELDTVLEECAKQTSGDHLEMLADLIISIHSVMLEQRIDSQHVAKVPPVMQAIVNQSWRQEKGNLPKLARWLRCIFRMTISTSPETALRVLDQAASIAVGSGLGRESQRYPSAELEWLASTAFNQAVDRFCASDHEGCRTWAEAALNLAKAAIDSPRLFAQMQGLWMRLQSQQQIE